MFIHAESTQHRSYDLDFDPDLNPDAPDTRVENDVMAEPTFYRRSATKVTDTHAVEALSGGRKGKKVKLKNSCGKIGENPHSNGRKPEKTYPTEGKFNNKVRNRMKVNIKIRENFSYAYTLFMDDIWLSTFKSGYVGNHMIDTSTLMEVSSIYCTYNKNYTH